MSKWFFINTMIFILVIWKVTSGQVTSHRIIGGLGMLFILYNWTRHAVFSTIRSNISRERKIKFAQLSKKALPFHKWTGTSALILILLHLGLVLGYFPLQIHNPKIVTGIIALFILINLVLFGWLRHIRTTVKRRYIHWTLAYLIIFASLVHIFI
ncbi:MAG TPA: hypothetical protein VFF20_05665 [Pseudogracilibacillus sp.]|nr:hypothetical protein [Pseudogracilibacillus sp.]